MRLIRLNAVSQSEKMDLQKFGKDSLRLSHNTDPHTYTLSNVQVVFHTVKSEFSLTNNIIMRSDRNRKRAKFYRCDLTKTQSV